MVVPPSESEAFLSQIPSITRFEALSSVDSFVSLPDDWYLYCCDVVNSTLAIKEGRYKQVNMVGAACIMAAINAAPDVELAYVFGGDGATIAVPGSLEPVVSDALARTRKLSSQEFGLEMRVGLVSVHEIRQEGADVSVAMLELSPGNRTALFSGGGAKLTDALVKADQSGRYQVSERDDKAPNLEGLSCRWEPLESRYGYMLCTLISAVSDIDSERAAVYGEAYRRIKRILSPDQKMAQPVRADNMRFRWPPRGLELESKFTRGDAPGLKHALTLYLQSFYQFIAEKFSKKLGNYNAPVYRKELRSNSDYRRFDDVLRLVLDVTPEQYLAIEAELSDMHAKGQIIFGTHTSESAQMTCLLFSLEDSRHIHFVDGSKGGFTYAARGMKAQAAELSQS